MYIFKYAPLYSTLISKSSSDGTTRNYAITISQTTITLDYLPSTFTSGFMSVSLTGLSLDSGSWHHIVITAVGTIASFYINGSFVGGQSLVGSVLDDSNREILLGQLFPCKLLKCCLFVCLFICLREREGGGAVVQHLWLLYSWLN